MPGGNLTIDTVFEFVKSKILFYSMEPVSCRAKLENKVQGILNDLVWKLNVILKLSGLV